MLEAQITDRLRSRVLRALVEADWSWLAGQRQGALLATLIGTVDRVSAAVRLVQMLAAALVTLAVMLGAALLIDPLPAAALGLGGLLVLALHLSLRDGAAREGEALGVAFGRTFAFLAERIAALRLIKSFGAEERELASGSAAMAELRVARRAYLHGLALGQFALQTGIAVVLALAVWLAVSHWHSSPATLLPLIAVSARSAPLLAAVQQGFHNTAHNWPALAELGALTCAAEAHREGFEPGSAPGGAEILPPGSASHWNGSR